MNTHNQPVQICDRNECDDNATFWITFYNYTNSLPQTKACGHHAVWWVGGSSNLFGRMTPIV